MKQLTKKQFKDLWGDGGPYSEAYLTIESRLLDNRVSRYKLRVFAKINPTTFEFCQKHQKEFKGNKVVLDILKNSFEKDPENGYECTIFNEDLLQGEQGKLFTKAQNSFNDLQSAILKMQQYVIDELGTGG